MHKDDLTRVRHMLDAAREALGITRNQTRSALETNHVLVLALVRLIEVIGEAAAQTSKEFQDAHPEIPWPQIIAMRNRLIHAYFDVDLDASGIRSSPICHRSLLNSNGLRRGSRDRYHPALEHAPLSSP